MANVEQLHLLRVEHMEQCLANVEQDRLLGIWRENAFKWLLRIISIIMQEANEWEEEFVDVLCSYDDWADNANDIDNDDGDGSSDDSVVSVI